MKFRATIQLEGKTATGIPVPADVVVGFGRGKRPPVLVTIRGYTYRSTVAAYGDVFMLPLSAENRAAAGVAAGDEVDVGIELDTEPREVSVPSDFAAALKRSPNAKKTFDALSYSRKRAHVLSIEGAKTPETRKRRIDKSIAELQGAGSR